MTPTVAIAPFRTEGRKAMMKPAIRMSAASTLNSAGPLAFDRNSMIRLNE